MDKKNKLYRLTAVIVIVLAVVLAIYDLIVYKIIGNGYATISTIIGDAYTQWYGYPLLFVSGFLLTHFYRMMPVAYQFEMWRIAALFAGGLAGWILTR